MIAKIENREMYPSYLLIIYFCLFSVFTANVLHYCANLSRGLDQLFLSLRADLKYFKPFPHPPRAACPMRLDSVSDNILIIVYTDINSTSAPTQHWSIQLDIKASLLAWISWP